MKALEYILLLPLIGIMLTSCNGTDKYPDAEAVEFQLKAIVPNSLPKEKGHAPRCIMELWTKSEKPVMIERQEKKLTQIGSYGSKESSTSNITAVTPVFFTLEVKPGEYECLLWVDYINEDAQPDTDNRYNDMYYNTEDLSHVRVINTQSMISNKAANAYCGHAELQWDGQASAPKEIMMTHPISAVQIKEQNLASTQILTEMTLNMESCSAFNVRNGEPEEKTETEYRRININSTDTEYGILFIAYMFSGKEVSYTGIPVNIKFNTTQGMFEKSIAAGNVYTISDRLTEISSLWLTDNDETTQNRLKIENIEWNGETEAIPNECITARVGIQSEIAKKEQIIDGEWVPIGPDGECSIQKDYSIFFNDTPSYRFEVKPGDNTIPGYGGGTKSRAELSYCYATADDFKDLPFETLENASKILNVYHYGKGILPQRCISEHVFSVYFPDNIDENAGIFAQIHNMPDRTLTKNPDGEEQMMTEAEFLKLLETTIFRENTGYEKIMETNPDGSPMYDEKGNIVYKRGEPNGWLIDAGCFPPLAFTISNGYVYIECNSCRSRLTDISDRTKANVKYHEVMQPVKSEYKTSIIAYKTPLSKFPKEQWVTFKVKIKWGEFGGVSETEKPGMIDAYMFYDENGEQKQEHIVDNATVNIGYNDEYGYYFKFGIYRGGEIETPITYNLAGYSQEIKDVW